MWEKLACVYRQYPWDEAQARPDTNGERPASRPRGWNFRPKISRIFPRQWRDIWLNTSENSRPIHTWHGYLGASSLGDRKYVLDSSEDGQWHSMRAISRSLPSITLIFKTRTGGDDPTHLDHCKNWRDSIHWCPGYSCKSCGEILIHFRLKHVIESRTETQIQARTRNLKWIIFKPSFSNISKR